MYNDPIPKLSAILLTSSCEVQTRDWIELDLWWPLHKTKESTKAICCSSYGLRVQCHQSCESWGPNDPISKMTFSNGHESKSYRLNSMPIKRFRSPAAANWVASPELNPDWFKTLDEVTGGFDVWNESVVPVAEPKQVVLIASSLLHWVPVDKRQLPWRNAPQRQGKSTRL